MADFWAAVLKRCWHTSWVAAIVPHIRCHQEPGGGAPTLCVSPFHHRVCPARRFWGNYWILTTYQYSNVVLPSICRAFWFSTNWCYQTLQWGCAPIACQIHVAAQILHPQTWSAALSNNIAWHSNHCSPHTFLLTTATMHRRWSAPYAKQRWHPSTCKGMPYNLMGY